MDFLQRKAAVGEAIKKPSEQGKITYTPIVADRFVQWMLSYPTSCLSKGGNSISTTVMICHSPWQRWRLTEMALMVRCRMLRRRGIELCTLEATATTQNRMSEIAKEVVDE